MNTVRKQSPDNGGDRVEKSFPALLGCLVALLALESAAVVVLVIWLAVQAAQARATDMLSGVALLVVAGLCAVWLLLTTVAAARRRPWMRASSITWHLLVLAVAVGCFTGVTAVPQAGWWLLAVALAGLVLVLSGPVTRATARDLPTVVPGGDGARPPSAR